MRHASQPARTRPEAALEDIDKDDSARRHGRTAVL